MKRLKAAFSNFPCSEEATKVGTNVGQNGWVFSSLTAVDGCFQFSNFPSFSRFPASLKHRREKRGKRKEKKKTAPKAPQTFVARAHLINY